MRIGIDFVHALRGGNCSDWIVPGGMQCKAQIAPRGHSHASNLQRGSAPAGGNPTGQFPPRKAYAVTLDIFINEMPDDLMTEVLQLVGN